MPQPATTFHQFEVTTYALGGAGAVTRLVIVPTTPSLPALGYWVARLQVHRVFRGRADIRSLGISTRQVWEIPC